MKKPSTKRDRLIITGLLLFALVPMLGGAFRITELSTGANVTPENARFFGDPVPVVVHIIGALLFAVLSPFQFIFGLRRRNLGWHRAAGKVILLSGLAVALTGLWMTLVYDFPAIDDEAVYVMRLVFGAAMAAALVLGFVAIRRRDIARHSAWMIRGYAIGLGAGTQVFTHLPWLIAGAAPDETGRAVAMGAGWIINLVVAEWIIRTKLPKPRRTRAVAPELATQ